jgi:hypothetical protein
VLIDSHGRHCFVVALQLNAVGAKSGLDDPNGVLDQTGERDNLD